MIRPICVVLVVAVLLSVLPVAVYATDYYVQEPVVADKTYNCTFRYWVVGNTNMYWRAPDSTYTTWVNGATSAWQTALSNKLTWANTSSGEDVLFGWSDLPDMTSARNTLQTWYYDSIRQAYYWTYATVNLNNTICFADNNVRSGALRHEIGHLCGLGDNYLSGGYCNPSPAPQTIMDGDKLRVDGCSVGPYTNYERCDGISIQARDVSLVNSYWGAGEAKNLNAVPNGSQVTITWDDYSWAENAYRAYFYKWNGSSWQYLSVVAVSSNTGSHETMINRTISYVWTGSGPGNYKVEVKPYFAKYGQYGTTKSKTFTLSQ